MYNENNKTIFDLMNYKNENILKLQESRYTNVEKASIESINNNNNQLSIHENFKNTFYNDYDIEKINKFENLNKYNVFDSFNYKTFLYNKVNFMIQSHLENRNILPLEEVDFVLKGLLKKDFFNYDYLLSNNSNKFLDYGDYIKAYKNDKIIYKNIFDIYKK